LYVANHIYDPRVFKTRKINMNRAINDANKATPIAFAKRDSND